MLLAKRCGCLLLLPLLFALAGAIVQAAALLLARVSLADSSLLRCTVCKTGH